MSKTILLDLDETIINSAPTIHKVLQILFNKYRQYEYSEELLLQFRGIPTRVVFRHINPQNVEELVEEGVRLEEGHRHLAPIYSGAQSMISKLAD